MYSEEIKFAGKWAEKKIGLLNESKSKYLMSSALAGFYVGIGVMLMSVAGGMFHATGSEYTKLVMGAVFGIALCLVIFAGADLFTGNNMVMTFGALNGNVSWKDAITIWIYSYIGNFLGAMFTVFMFVQAGVINSKTADFIAYYSEAKITVPAGQLFIRAIMCNIIVCLAVWCTIKMKDETAKILMMAWLILAFVAIGFEHSIANMSFLAMGLSVPHGEAVNIMGYIYNIGIATIGNIIGGAIFVTFPYYFINKKKDK